MMTDNALTVDAPMSTHAAVHTFLTTALAALVATYVAVLAWYSPLTAQDLPNHLARGYVMADLMFHQGVIFGESFKFQFLFATYVLGDLVLAGLVDLFGVTPAAAIWTAMALVSLPVALALYLRALRITPVYRNLALLLSLVLATDRFFLMGMMNFRLGIAGLFVALAMVESLRERWSVWRYAGLVAAIWVLYLIHLVPIVFLGAAIGVTALVRLYRGTTRVGREVALVVPVVTVLIWHLLSSGSHPEPQAFALLWGTPLRKLLRVGWDFYRFRPHWDCLVVILVAASILLVSKPWRWLRSSGEAALETWALALVFLAMFVVLPEQYAEASAIDTRAGAVLAIWLVVGCVRLSDTAVRPVSLWSAGVLAVVAVLINLVAVGRPLGQDEAWLNRYRALLTAIPQRSRVLPVYTSLPQKGIKPFLHAQAFIAIDRAALVPYLFSADQGHPMAYFRYLHHPYAPFEEWYTKEPGRWPVDWARVARQYEYLVVIKPFDPARLPLASRTIAENDVAVVLAIDAKNLNPPVL